MPTHPHFFLCCTLPTPRASEPFPHLHLARGHFPHRQPRTRRLFPTRQTDQEKQTKTKTPSADAAERKTQPRRTTRLVPSPSGPENPSLRGSTARMCRRRHAGVHAHAAPLCSWPRRVDHSYLYFFPEGGPSWPLQARLRLGAAAFHGELCGAGSDAEELKKKRGELRCACALLVRRGPRC